MTTVLLQFHFKLKTLPLLGGSEGGTCDGVAVTLQHPHPKSGWEGVGWGDSGEAGGWEKGTARGLDPEGLEPEGRQGIPRPAAGSALCTEDAQGTSGSQ